MEWEVPIWTGGYQYTVLEVVIWLFIIEGRTLSVYRNATSFSGHLDEGYPTSLSTFQSGLQFFTDLLNGYT